MVDTIIFRIYDVFGSFDPTFKRMTRKGIHFGITELLLTDTKEGFTKLQKKIFFNLGEKEIIKNVYQNHKIDKEYVSYIAKDLKTPSSNYNLTCRLNVRNNFAEFNFSVPKYIYGSNVYQFVDSITSPKFNFSINKDWETNAKNTHPRLISFIKQFLKELFPSIIINYDMVGIVRADFCFNQHFKTKKNALEYLSYQRNIKKKNLPADSKFEYEDETLFFKSKTYSSKIYHKGSEFAKNDSKELKKKGVSAEEINELQQLADKILRYEITFRMGKLNYLYRRHLFRANCTRWQMNVKEYKRIRNLTLANERKNIFTTLNPQERKVFEYVNKHYNRSASFRLSLPDHLEHQNHYTPERDYPLSFKVFDSALVRLCINELKGFFDTFQLSQRPPISDLHERIDNINKKAKERSKTLISCYGKYSAIPKSLRPQKIPPMLKVLLDRVFDDEEFDIKEPISKRLKTLRNKNIIEERTFYKYKKIVKEVLDIDMYAVSNIDFFASKDFTDYHLHIRSSKNHLDHQKRYNLYILRNSKRIQPLLSY